MIRRSFFSAAVAILMSFCQSPSAHAAGPEEQLVETVKVALGKNFNTDWSGLDALPGIKWAPLPQTSLQNCLPDGGCFARQGAAKFGDHSLTVHAAARELLATGSLGDDIFTAAESALGYQRLADVVGVIGHFSTTAMMANVVGAEAPADAPSHLKR